MYAKFFAVAAFVSAAVAVALPQTNNISQCNTGPVQCCNSMQSSDHHDTTSRLQGLGVADIAGLLSGLTGQAGVTCTPIGLGQLGGNSCSSQPVCCSNNSFNGVVALGCTPININA